MFGYEYTSQLVRVIGLCCSTLALVNIMVFSDVTVNGVMAPNVSTLLANGRGSYWLFWSSFIQAIAVALAHVPVLIQMLQRSSSDGEEEEKEESDSDTESVKSVMSEDFEPFEKLGQNKEHTLVTVNVATWCLCSLTLCLLITVPLCPKPGLQAEAWVEDQWCSDVGHTIATVLLFLLPFGSFALIEYLEWTGWQKFYKRWQVILFDRNWQASADVATLSQALFAGSSAATAILMLTFQLLCGPATDQGGWIALVAFEIEVLAIDTLLYMGQARMIAETEWLALALSRVFPDIGYLRLRTRYRKLHDDAVSKLRQLVKRGECGTDADFGVFLDHYVEDFENYFLETSGMDDLENKYMDALCQKSCSMRKIGAEEFADELDRLTRILQQLNRVYAYLKEADWEQRKAQAEDRIDKSGISTTNGLIWCCWLIMLICVPLKALLHLGHSMGPPAQ